MTSLGKKPVPLLWLAIGLAVGVGMVCLWSVWQQGRELARKEREVLRQFAANRQTRIRRSAGQPPSLSPTPENPVVSGLTRAELAQRRMEVLLRQPDYARFVRRDLRRQTMRRYGDLLIGLALPPDRLEALKEALDARAAELREEQTVLAADGMASDASAVRGAKQESRMAWERRLRELLGAADCVRFRDYEQTEPWRRRLQPELDEYLADAGLPALSPEQVAALRAAYAAAGGGESTTSSRDAWRKNMAELAATNLTDGQYRGLMDFLEFDRERGAVMARLAYPDGVPDGVMIGKSVSRP